MSEHSATLVAMTQPVPGMTSCNTVGELLAYFARISNAANQGNHKTGPRLIRRLIKDGEWSPLDQVTCNFEIVTNRRIARQILRHWTIKPQEFSQRWAAVPDRPYYTPARMADPKDRANALPCKDQGLVDWWHAAQQEVWDRAVHIYRHALDSGLHREVACAVLPEGMAPSRMYCQATVRTWLHYSLLRMRPNTQREHQIIAEQVWGQLVGVFPELVAALEDAHEPA